VEFFGEKARMMGGPAALAVQTGAALMPVILWFEGDHWGVHVHEEIPVPAEGDSKQKTAAMMQQVARLFEAGIRAHPQDWHMLQRVAGVSRFPSRDHFASCNGTAPVEVSSGNRKIHRLSLRGNRRVNHAIHMAAITQIRHRHSEGRAYYDKKLAEGKTHKEALRCLKRKDQRRHLRPPPDRRPHGRSLPGQGSGRAPGERLCIQRGQLTPRMPALRTSHSRTWHQPTTQHHYRHTVEAGPEKIPDNHLAPRAKRTRSGRSTEGLGG
jgi:hypothetical protein